MIAVIGGGISGLAVAIELQKWCEPCIVFEAGNTPGGVIQSEFIEDYLLEYGANSILVDSELKEYLKKLGLENEIYYPKKTSKNRYIFKKGKRAQLPSNPVNALFGNFLSFKSKAALIKELYKTPSPVKNETLGELIERRFNKEIADYILAPFISGVYAGDPYKLLVSETYPVLHQYEEQYGSILKGFIKNKNGSRKESIYFKSGMQALTDAMSKKVKNLRTRVIVENIEKDSKGYTLKLSTPNGTESLQFEAIVISAPAYKASEILRSSFPDLATAFEKVNYAPIVKVFTAYNEKDIQAPLNGFGALNPPCENEYVLGSLFNSSIYPFVAPMGTILLTTMVGGAIQEGHAKMKDEFILNRVKSDLSEYYQIKKAPVFSYLKRMEKAIPQYDNESIQAKEAAYAAEKEGIFVCANWIGGPSLADCIKKAQKMALRITESRAGITDHTGCC